MKLEIKKFTTMNFTQSPDTARRTGLQLHHFISLWF